MSRLLQELYESINAGRPTVAVPAVLLHAMTPAQAILMAQLLYWCDQAGGEAHKTAIEIEMATGLNRFAQHRLLRQLDEFGLEIDRRGFPAVNYFRVNLDQLADAVKPHMLQNRISGNQDVSASPDVAISHVGCDSLSRSVFNKMSHLTSTKERVLKEGEGDDQLLQNVTSEQPPQRVETRTTTTDQLPVAMLGWGQSVPTPANPYPQDSHRQGLEAEQRIQTAAPRLGARLVELRRISGRTEHNYRLWLRDFVAPHIERLGPAFALSLEAALKQGVLANPQYALRDVVKSLEAASPPPKEVMRKLTEAEILDDIIARFSVVPVAGGDHGPN